MDPFSQDPAAMFDGGDTHGLEQTHLQFDQVAQEYAAEAGLMPGETVDDPTQPLRGFAEQWRDQDGQWLGDEAERSAAYGQALQESYGLSSYALASQYAIAAESPPWAQGGPGETWDPGAMWGGYSGDVPGTSWTGYWQASLPTGEPVMVTGLDPYWSDAGGLDIEQGDEVPSAKGTCGIVSCENILHQFGLPVTEGDVLTFAAAAGLCQYDPFGNPGDNGGTNVWSREAILEAYGVPATVYTGGLTTGDLAEALEDGRAVDLSVNAGVLWDDPYNFGNGAGNHSIILTGVGRDYSTGAVEGFWVCDSGAGDPSMARRFVSVEELAMAWTGPTLITDVARTDGWSPSAGGPLYA